MDRDATLTFRLPADTRAALEHAAEAERRSMSGLAVLVLERWLAAEGYLRKPKQRRARGSK